MKKIMRIGIAFAALAILKLSTIGAQSSGVFKTYSDFQTGKIEYGINCENEKHKIKLNDFIGRDHITVIHEGKSYKLKKADIWGYQLCDGKIVRFKGKEYFPLEDSGVLWIYTKEIAQTTGRGATKKTIVYYFSKGGNGNIEELTLQNVKSAFPDNHKLHDAIDVQFKSDASLSEFDQYHKHFKINHFLENQIKK